MSNELTKAMKEFRSNKSKFPPEIITEVERLIKVFESADTSIEYVAACSVVYEGMKKIKTNPPSTTLRAIQMEAKEAVKRNPYTSKSPDELPVSLSKSMVQFKINKSKYKPEYYDSLHKLIQAYERSTPSNRKATLQALKTQIDKGGDAGSNTVKEMKREVEDLLRTAK